MPKNLFPLDNSKKFTNQKHVGHNHWHPQSSPELEQAAKLLKIANLPAIRLQSETLSISLRA